MQFNDIENLITHFGKEHPTYWGCALAGEAGEVANLLKKLERDGLYETANKLRYDGNLSDEVSNEQIFSDSLGEELADVFIYLVLTARLYPHIDLQKSILDKIEKVAERRRAE